mmetsp:Transcript_22379/g.48169  ORF Transcript_22379/g.48169 Transcript_22379/m.48169 type:complete len:202 (-) Transcript_22379:213-818(-)
MVCNTILHVHGPRKNAFHSTSKSKPIAATDRNHLIQTVHRLAHVLPYGAEIDFVGIDILGYLPLQPPVHDDHVRPGAVPPNCPDGDLALGVQRLRREQDAGVLLVVINVHRVVCQILSQSIDISLQNEIVIRHRELLPSLHEVGERLVGFYFRGFREGGRDRRGRIQEEGSHRSLRAPFQHISAICYIRIVLCAGEICYYP